MTANDELKNTLEGLSHQPSGDKLMQAVVMTAGPGTKVLELTRSGSARTGIKAWVGSEPVVWLTTDRSALMPVTTGTHTATYEVVGSSGGSWSIRTTKPPGATGGASDTLPSGGRIVGQFRIVVP